MAMSILFGIGNSRCSELSPLKKHRPKNVQKSTEKRSKNGPRGLPGGSPGPPWGLPGASLRPPGAILEDMQRNAKKQEKQKVFPDPIS